MLMKKLIEADHEDPVLSTFVLFTQMGQAAHKYSEDRLSKNSNLSAPMFIALNALTMCGGTMSYSQLGEWTEAKLNPITGLVGRMIKAGLITRERSPADRRFVLVKITTKGRKALDQASPVCRRIMESVMRGIDDQKVAELEDLLNVIKANLEDSALQPGP